MGMNLHELNHLSLSNSSFTSDMIKTLKKKVRPKYTFLEVLYQQKFDHLLFYKECMHFKVVRNKHKMLLDLSSLQPKTKLMYLGHLSKAYVEYMPSIRITKITGILLLEDVKDMLLSLKTKQNLSDFVHWD